MVSRESNPAKVKAPLTSGAGDLWVMVALNQRTFRDEDDIALVDDLAEYLESNGLAELDGESSGAGSMDISFYTPSVKRAAVKAAQFLEHNYPGLRFYISDEYETLFDE